MHPTMPDTTAFTQRLPLPALQRLRDLSLVVIDHLWFATAVMLGLLLSYWLCMALGLPSPLAPFSEPPIL